MLRTAYQLMIMGLLIFSQSNVSAHTSAIVDWPCDRLHHAAVHEKSRIIQNSWISQYSDRASVQQKNNFDAMDKWALSCPDSKESDLIELTKYLIQPAKTQLEKARVLFVWIVNNINYDDVAYNTGNYPVYTAQNVLKSKKAVCEGFSVLYEAMCTSGGLEAEKIHGYSKGYGYHLGQRMTETNHAWNAVKIDKQWRLFDVTWAEGNGKNVNGKLVSTKKFQPFWFDVDPKAFVFTHYPVNTKWLNLGEPMTLKQFETLPEIDESIFSLGFQPADVFAKAISFGIRYFVQTYDTEAKVEAVRMPLHVAVVKGKQISLEFHSASKEMAICDEKGNWIYFIKEGNVFTLDYTPSGNKIFIMVKANEKAKFETLATYKVK